MAKNRHNAAFVVGSVLGGLVGAGVALWKTPYSGPELRAMLTGESQAGGTGTGEPLRFSSKLLSQVENALAPVVGVKLGKTANDSGPLAAPAAPPSSAATREEVTPASESHAATVEELTHPRVDIQPEAVRQPAGEMKPFPEFGDNEPVR